MPQAEKSCLKNMDFWTSFWNLNSDLEPKLSNCLIKQSETKPLPWMVACSTRKEGTEANRSSTQLICNACLSLLILRALYKLAFFHPTKEEPEKWRHTIVYQGLRLGQRQCPASSAWCWGLVTSAMLLFHPFSKCSSASFVILCVSSSYACMFSCFLWLEE